MDRQVVSELYERFATSAVLAFNEMQVAAPTLILLRVRESDGAVEDSCVIDPSTVNDMQVRGTLLGVITQAFAAEDELPGLAANVVIHIAEGRVVNEGNGEHERGLLVAVHTREGCRLGICPIHHDTTDERRSAEFRPMCDGVWGTQTVSTTTCH